MRKSRTILYFRLAILFEILWGAHAWFTWGIDQSRILQYIVYITIAIISLIYKTKMRMRISFSPHLVLAATCYMLGVLFFNRFSLPSLASIILILIPIMVLINDKDNVQGHLSFVAKGLAYIIIPGIILYITSMFVFIPGPLIQKGTAESYLFYNHIFQVVRVDNYSFADRFHSVFLEPGYLGAMLSFLFFALKYDFSKWHSRVLLLALILSFSLAGYIVTFIGYIIHSLVNDRSIKRVIFASILLMIVYNVSLSYNNGENYINKLIVERLAYDEDKGIVGNNRTGDGTDFYYEQAVSMGKIWMGFGADEVARINGGSSYSAGYDTNIRGAGYKVYFVTYGVISAIFFFLFYYFITRVNRKNRLMKLGFLLLVVLTFIQVADPQSASWVYPFVLGVVSLSSKSIRST